MNPLVLAVMRLFAAPRLDMRTDYPRVRRLQRRLASLPGTRYRAVDVRVPADERSIPVRVFRPREQRRDDLLVFFHGGGWVTGDIESYTPACAAMADLTGCIVASVDYRLAPEHPFPAGLDDCFAVTVALLADPSIVPVERPGRIVLVGDSAGGNLAAAVSLRLRDEQARGVDLQILLYPVTYWDHRPETSPFPSVREHGQDYRLTDREVQDYLDLYVPDVARRRQPLVAPLLATDLTEQPPTLVIPAELDLLHDEGVAYGRALAAAGDEVRIHTVAGALHGFITLPRFARPLREAYEVIDAFLDGEPDPGRPVPRMAGR